MPNWAIAILSLIGGFILHLVYESYREKRKLRNEGLRNHFKDLEAKVIKPISEIMGQITNSEGTLWLSGEARFYNPSHYWPTKDFKEGEFSGFKLHFPSQADIAVRLITEIDKHNENNKSLLNKLTKVIKENTGIPIKNIVKSTGIAEERPFIYAKVPTYVQKTLYHFAARKINRNEKDTIYRDFRKAKIERKDDAWWVYSESIGDVYAQVKTKEEANLCKQTLIQLMESDELIEETCGMYREAKRLENESRSLASLLDFVCQQHDKYGKLLKRERDCPVCQVIFE